MKNRGTFFFTCEIVLCNWLNNLSQNQARKNAIFVLQKKPEDSLSISSSLSPLSVIIILSKHLVLDVK